MRGRNVGIQRRRSEGLCNLVKVMRQRPSVTPCKPCLCADGDTREEAEGGRNDTSLYLTQPQVVTFQSSHQDNQDYPDQNTMKVYTLSESFLTRNRDLCPVRTPKCVEVTTILLLI